MAKIDRANKMLEKIQALVNESDNPEGLGSEINNILATAQLEIAIAKILQGKVINQDLIASIHELLTDKELKKPLEIAENYLKQKNIKVSDFLLTIEGQINEAQPSVISTNAGIEEVLKKNKTKFYFMNNYLGKKYSDVAEEFTKLGEVLFREEGAYKTAFLSSHKIELLINNETDIIERTIVDDCVMNLW